MSFVIGELTIKIAESEGRNDFLARKFGNEFLEKVINAEKQIPGFKFNQLDYFMNGMCLENQIQRYAILLEVANGNDGELSLED